jgi:hypothetical protein
MFWNSILDFLTNDINIWMKIHIKLRIEHFSIDFYNNFIECQRNYYSG